jgi:hypothetical protein
MISLSKVGVSEFQTAENKLVIYLHETSSTAHLAEGSLSLMFVSKAGHAKVVFVFLLIL